MPHGPLPTRGRQAAEARPRAELSAGRPGGRRGGRGGGGGAQVPFRARSAPRHISFSPSLQRWRCLATAGRSRTLLARSISEAPPRRQSRPPPPLVSVPPPPAAESETGGARSSLAPQALTAAAARGAGAGARQSRVPTRTRGSRAAGARPLSARGQARGGPGLAGEGGTMSRRVPPRRGGGEGRSLRDWSAARSPAGRRGGSYLAVGSGRSLRLSLPGRLCRRGARRSRSSPRHVQGSEEALPPEHGRVAAVRLQPQQRRVPGAHG